MRNFCFLVMLLLAPSAVSAQCDPVQFLVSDIQNVAISDEFKTAFLHVATKDQYLKATEGGKTSMAYGAISGSLEYDKAKTSASKEAELRQYKFDRSFYMRYVTQQLSPVGADAYTKCLEQDRNSPGLRLWFSNRDGDFYTIKGFWVGQDTGKGSGELEGTPVTKGFEVIQLPKTWVKGQTLEILLQKPSDVDGVISIKVDGQQRSFVAVRDLPPIQMATNRVDSPKLVSIASGGTHDGKSPSVLPRKETSCVYPSKPDRLLLVGSGSIVDGTEAAAPGTVTKALTTDSPHEICYTFTSMTGDKKVRNSISGRASALERYVLRN
ncbi:MAG: hypothetical protein J0H42_21165 [Rhizobiales bacterium]|nr:hypothetical protein [Hyphomicrobiales bacterium]